MSRPTLSPEAAAACADDIRRFEEETAAQKNGTLPFPEYKGRRARHGTYEQRQDGRFMIRPRFPAGVLTTAAARAAAAASRTAGDGVLHLTTRQDVQIHGVPEDRVPGVGRLGGQQRRQDRALGFGKLRFEAGDLLAGQRGQLRVARGVGRHFAVALEFVQQLEIGVRDRLQLLQRRVLAHLRAVDLGVAEHGGG